MGYAITIERVGLRAVFDVKGTPDAALRRLAKAGLDLPTSPNRLIRQNAITVCWVAAENWLIIAPITVEDRLIAALDIATIGTDNPNRDMNCWVTHVSDAYCFFDITGNDAATAVAIASPLDIREDIFGTNGASYTEFFGICALVTRHEAGFLIAVDRSYGDMIAEYLQNINPSNSG